MGGRRTLTVLVALALGCGEEEQLFNVFEPPPPVAEIPCPGADASGPWIAEASPVAEGLGDVWGSGPRNVYAVGASGTIIRWDGDAWQNVSPSIGVDLLAVHGLAADDIWAVGRAGVALHFDGNAWNEVPTGTTEVLTGVFAVATDDVWMIGDDGVRRWNGERIAAEPGWPAVPLNGLWASSARDVRIVGDTAVYRFDGAVFQTQPIEHAGKLAAVWGTDAMNVWTIGHNSMNRPGFAELKGDNWLFSAAPPRGVYFSLWTLSPDELWAGANDTTIFYRKDGEWCREFIDGIGAINAFWGPSRNDVWAVGARRAANGTATPVLLRRRAP